MSVVEKIAEQKIREAMAQGEFDGLSGAGKPLERLDSYFATPEQVRLGYPVLKSAGIVPEEVQLRREIYLLRQQLEGIDDAGRREKVSRDIRALELKYELLMNQFRRSPR
jgi:hypothetical protein